MFLHIDHVQNYRCFAHQFHNFITAAAKFRWPIAWVFFFLFFKLSGHPSSATLVPDLANQVWPFKSALFKTSRPGKRSWLTREASATERHGNDRLSKRAVHTKDKCKRPDRLSNQFGIVWYTFWLLPGQHFHDNWALFARKKARLVEQQIQLFFFFLIFFVDCFRVNIFLTTGHFFHLVY